jgi:competence protein ComEC
LKLYLYPFVWLFIPFAIGINCFDYSILSDSLVYIFILVCLFSFFVFKNAFKNSYSFIFPWITGVLLFFLGVVFTRFYLDDKNNTLLFGKELKLIGSVETLGITKSGYTKCELKITSFVDENKVSSCGNNLLVICKERSLSKIDIGDQLVLFGEVQRFKYFHNPGEFNAPRYYKYKKIDGVCFVDAANYRKLPLKNSISFLNHFLRIRNELSHSLSEVLSGEELNLAQALVLGDRDGLDVSTNDAFANTGAMHILAVSGLHVGILMQILIKVFSFFSQWINKRRATFLALIIIWFYALLSGFSPSIVRSVVMFSLLSIASLYGKSHSDINVLAFSAFVLLLWKPFFLYDVGFQLTYAAMLGIYWFYPLLKKQFYSRFKIIQLIYEGTVIGIAAQITTLPLTLYYFHQFPNYFILTNIALMSFSFIILSLALCLSVFFWFSSLKIFFGFLLQKVLSWMLLIVHFVDDLPGSVAYGYDLKVSSVFLMFILVVLLFVGLYFRFKKLLYVTLSLVLVFTVYISYVRYDTISSSFICFLGGEKPLIVIRNNQMNTFLTPKYLIDKKSFKNSVKSFGKVYPGKSRIRLIGNNKMYYLSIGKTLHQYRFLSSDKIVCNSLKFNEGLIKYPLLNPIYKDLH